MASLEHLASIMAQKLTEHFRELMDTVAGARISAGDLRRMGFDIEGSVPDRATIETAALTVQHGQHEAEIQTLNMRLTLDLDRFEWFDMHEVLDELSSRVPLTDEQRAELRAGKEPTNPGEDDGSLD